MPTSKHKISIEEKEKTENGWVFMVRITGGKTQTEHEVSLPKSYYDELTAGNANPEELIRKSFEFLLEREGPEQILRNFELPEIQRYFGEYEDEMKKLSGQV